MVFQGNCTRSRTGQTIKLLIVSITNFSIVIGSPRGYLSRNRRVITWVSDLNFFKAWIFFQIFLRSSNIYFTYLLRSNVYKLLGALRNNWRSYDVIFKGIHVHKQHISKPQNVKRKIEEADWKEHPTSLWNLCSLTNPLGRVHWWNHCWKWLPQQKERRGSLRRARRQWRWGWVSVKVVLENKC